MEQATDWIPAIVVLSLGVLIGVVVYWRYARREPPALSTEVALESRDQRARFDGLIQQLRELDDLAAKRTPAQLARERRALETEAALALRELSTATALSSAAPRQTSAPETPAEVPPPPRSAVPGFLWGAGTVLAVTALIVFVSQGAFDRPPGGSLTGGSMSPAPASPSGGPMIDLTGLEQAVANNPDDYEARLDLAQAMLITRDINGVAAQTRYVLTRQPDHPRALSYASLVELASGNIDQALGMAERSIAGDPANPETWVHLALIQVQKGSIVEAESTLRSAIARFPADAAALEGILGELIPSAAAGTAAPSGGSVTIALEAGRPGGGIVFVFVYPAGSSEPVAVRRESLAALPARLTLGVADLMSGTALPEQMRIEARLDGDGLARTREPGDLEGSVVGVTPGSSITIRLEPVG